jgi:hypothetical protein
MLVFKIYYTTQAHMCNISKHNNIIQYVNIENMGDREGISKELTTRDTVLINSTARLTILLIQKLLGIPDSHNPKYC